MPDSPRFCSIIYYEEDNWVDDIALAAVELYKSTKDEKYMKRCKLWQNGTLTPGWGLIVPDIISGIHL
jgi:hypothetical protein